MTHARSDAGWLARFDAWMAEHPWHPRIVPFAVYIFLLLPIGVARDHWVASYAPLYVMQCAIVLWLLWRYRKLLPEMNWKFHWLAVPVGVAIAVVWIGLGKWMVQLWPDKFAQTEEHYFLQMEPDALRYTALGLRLLGMSIVVPMFEELFVRSLLLRSLRWPRRVAIGIVQWLEEVPVIGEWFMNTKLAQRADRHERVFGYEFTVNELGVLSVCGVTLSTLIFMFHHGMRDWPGAIVCGVAYCLLLRVTRHKGLGPVIWAHGLTNALLWGYSLQTGDWQFL